MGDRKMVGRVYSGKELLSEANKKEQGKIGKKTFKEICETIRKKYKKLEINAKYYHRGDGEWTRYNQASDRIRISKKEYITNDKKKHAKYPHVYDTIEGFNLALKLKKEREEKKRKTKK